jgi:RNA polymerase sigma-70 factor (ECF subfamily)
LSELKELSDSLLTNRAVEDPIAFGVLYDRYFLRIYNYIRYRGVERSQAEDITADVFERALIAFDQYDPNIAPFTVWIFSIARNLIIDWFRTHNKSNLASLYDQDDLLSSDPSPEQALINDQDHSELISAIMRLEDRDQDILSLKFGSLLSNRAISKLTGFSETHIAVIIYRAIRKLRKMLETREHVHNG